MRYLQMQGHQVYNVIPDNGEHADDYYLKFMEDHHIELFQLKTNKWWWPEAYQLEETDLVSVFAYQHKNIFQIRQLINNKQIDLVISNTVNVFQGAMAAALESVAHYQIIHEFPIGQFNYYRKKIDLINRLSDKIFVVTGELYRELGKYFPEEKLFPFIPYSQLDEFPLKNVEKNRIVSIGGISQWKNQLELVQAYEKIAISEIELVFIGSWEPEYKEELDNYIFEKGLTNITFLGYQKSPFRLLTDKDILVLPSKIETFGLVYVESILSAVPAVVSDNLGHKTVSEYFGTRNEYPLGNVEALVEKINWLLENFDSEKRLALKLSHRAREVYTLEKTSQIFLDKMEGAHPESREAFKALNYFIGWDLALPLLESISNQKVTVYHSNEQPYYKKESYEIKTKDELVIEVGLADFIRIDLTEEAGFYDEAIMVDQVTGKVLEPVHSNAFRLGDRFLFLDRDPQLVYDTSMLHHHKLTFSYVKGEFSELTENVQEYIDDKLELARLSDIEAKYQNLEREYSSVVHSRRWTLTTKIINFFRRK